MKTHEMSFNFYTNWFSRFVYVLTFPALDIVFENNLIIFLICDLSTYHKLSANYISTEYYLCIFSDNTFIVTVSRLQTPTNFICVSVCVSVCPTFTAYVSLTLGRILIRLGENVGTLVRLIVSKFHCATPLGLCATSFCEVF